MLFPAYEAALEWALEGSGQYFDDEGPAADERDALTETYSWSPDEPEPRFTAKVSSRSGLCCNAEVDSRGRWKRGGSVEGVRVKGWRCTALGLDDPPAFASSLRPRLAAIAGSSVSECECECEPQSC